MSVSTCKVCLQSVVFTFLCLGLVMPAVAQSGGHGATLSFSTPVQLPGVTLPAGTYLFEYVTGPERAAVQVWTARGRRMVGRFVTIATKRASSGNAVTFLGAGTGVPPALAAWYPNGTDGQQFVYSKSELRAFAASQPAPATEVAKLP